MQWIWTALSVLMLTLASVGAQISGDAHAVDLLNQARAALGGEARLAQVTGLSCAGTYTREVGDRQVSGELTIDLQLPDKMLRTDSMNPMGDATITVEQGFNGDTLLRHSATRGGGPNMMIRLAGPSSPDAQAQMLKTVKADAARLTLAMLLSALPSLPLEASFAGEADAPDGTRADVVDARGPGSFAARLFLDQSSHRPLMLTYRGVAPRIVMSRQRVEGPPPGAEHMKEAERQVEAGAPPEIVDINMYFDDYRQESGIWLPHRVSRSIAGKPNEEWTFKTIAVNPAFKADTFEPKP